MTFKEQLLNSWQQPTWLTYTLLPLAWFYQCLFILRAWLFRLGLFKSYRAPIPIVVVGNITVGGTGKTPMVIYLVELLREKGFKPAVISRGYSGQAASYPLNVLASTPVAESGDEPALIVRRTGVPMAVGANRVESIKMLLDAYDIDIIISDDGLQHIAMQRDIEICLVDDTNDSCNSYCLPAGPNREPQSRLQSVDFVVHHVAENTLRKNEQTQILMSLEAGQPTILNSNSHAWDAKQEIHAVAGIGNPQRFFNTCRAMDLKITEHPFPDHHQFSLDDLNFDDDKAILMTEKDAVKCSEFADDRLWSLPVNAKLSAGFNDRLLILLKEKNVDKI